MATDKWETRALPILEYIDGLASDVQHVQVKDISQATGLPGWEILEELKRLIAAEYILINRMMIYASGHPESTRLMKPQLGEKGCQAVGSWPSDDIYAALLEILDRRIENEPDPATRSRFESLKGALATIGTGTATELLVQLLSSVPHIH